MDQPLQITYRGLKPSEPLNRLIRKEAEKLGSFFDRIVSCRVLVEPEQRHLRNGAPFRVHIDLIIPGSELTIDTARGSKPALSGDDESAKRRKSGEADAEHKDPALTVRDAFRRARRRLRDRIRRMQG
ncbi:MAG TPA: HPF/RaiA family ribosome-associated protein [Candidatus Nitrosotalea sp.]|nr:HPF/RaiA family ribosome-associated protein [Candidatus Nitrosotalea sp.]